MKKRSAFIFLLLLLGADCFSQDLGEIIYTQTDGFPAKSLSNGTNLFSYGICSGNKSYDLQYSLVITYSYQGKNIETKPLPYQSLLEATKAAESMKEDKAVMKGSSSKFYSFLNFQTGYISANNLLNWVICIRNDKNNFIFMKDYDELLDVLNDLNSNMQKFIATIEQK